MYLDRYILPLVNERFFPLCTGLIEQFKYRVIINFDQIPKSAGIGAENLGEESGCSGCEGQAAAAGWGGACHGGSVGAPQQAAAGEPQPTGNHESDAQSLNI